MPRIPKKKIKRPIGYIPVSQLESFKKELVEAKLRAEAVEQERDSLANAIYPESKRLWIWTITELIELATIQHQDSLVVDEIVAEKERMKAEINRLRRNYEQLLQGRVVESHRNLADGSVNELHQRPGSAFGKYTRADSSAQTDSSQEEQES